MKSNGVASIGNDPSSSIFFLFHSFFLLFFKFLRLNRGFRGPFYERWILKLYVLINNCHVSCEVTQTIFCLGNAIWEEGRFLYISYITCLQISNDLHLRLNNSKILLQTVHIPTYFRLWLPPST
jgi:hypothetical protein